MIAGTFTRREAVASSLALIFELAASALKAQTPQSGRSEGQRGVTVLPPFFKHDLPDLIMEGWEVTVTYVDYPPGVVGPVHHHAGFVLVYVLEGALVTKISSQDERTYHAGEMFFEPPGSTHEVSNNASATQPTKLLAMVFAKKGATLTTAGPA